MFNLYQIVTGAQGGQALDNLAQQFGITRDQADDAVKALIPALSTAFMTKAAQPGGMSEIAGAMGDDQHKLAYVDPSVAQDASTQSKGGNVAGSIFGSSAILEQVVEQAAKYTGLPAVVLRQMMPVIISMVLGGVATAMHNQGLGGMLGQLANSGLGNIFGGGQTPGQTSAPAQESGLGGMFGNILGSLFGGGQHANPTPQPQPNTPGQTQSPTADWLQNPAIKAGMDALGKMFQPGVQPHPNHPDDLSEQIGSILDGKKS